MKRLVMLLAAFSGAGIGAGGPYELVPSPQMPNDDVYTLPGVWSWSPGFYAPKYSQRKSRKLIRQAGSKSRKLARRLGRSA